MLPTLAQHNDVSDEIFRRNNFGRVARRRDRFDYSRLSPARKPTKRTLRTVAKAQSAPLRAAGIDPGEIPSALNAFVPCWNGREQMLETIHYLATLETTAELCRRNSIAVSTWAAITRNDAIDADSGTGLFRTSKATATSRVNRGEEQVKRARRVSRNLGILTELYRGATMSRDQRAELLAAKPGHRQHGFASIYRFGLIPPERAARIVPARSGHWATIGAPSAPEPDMTPVDNPAAGGVDNPPPVWKKVPPPPWGNKPLNSPLEIVPLSRFADDAAQPAAAPSPQKPGRGGFVKRVRRHGMRLAHELREDPRFWDMFELGTFGKVLAPARFAALLSAHEYGGWHGSLLMDEMLWHAQQRGIPTWGALRNPFGVLKLLLEQIDPVEVCVIGPVTDRINQTRAARV